MDIILSKLSPDLHEIYQLELSLGNVVERVDEPAGTKCPYGIVFAKPLHKEQIETALTLSAAVYYDISDDPHYPIEGMYLSQTSRHAISGPLKH